MYNDNRIPSETSNPQSIYSFSEVDALLKNENEKNYDGVRDINKIKNRTISYNDCCPISPSDCCGFFCIMPILACCDGVKSLAGNVCYSFAICCIGFLPE